MLPNTAQSMQQFTALAQKIRQMGGEASIVELRFTDPADELQMTARFKKQVDDEYTELLADCANVLLMLKRPNQPLTAEETEKNPPGGQAVPQNAFARLFQGLRCRGNRSRHQ